MKVDHQLFYYYFHFFIAANVVVLRVSANRGREVEEEEVAVAVAVAVESFGVRIVDRIGKVPKLQAVSHRQDQMRMWRATPIIQPIQKTRFAPVRRRASGGTTKYGPIKFNLHFYLCVGRTNIELVTELEMVIEP